MPLDWTLTRFGCVGFSMHACAVLLKSNVANILLFNFCDQKFVQHGPITIAIDCNGLSFLAFVEKLPNYDQNLHQTVTRFDCVGFSMYATILLVSIPAKIKMSFIWKYDFFCPKSASFLSRPQAHLAKRCSSVYTTIFVRRKDKTNYVSNQTWAKCYHSRNKHYLKKKNVRWRTLNL